MEIDDDDLPKEAVEESSSEAEDADAGAYELVKRGRGDGSSASSTTEQDPPEDAGREKRQKMLQDPASSVAARPSSSRTAPCLPKKVAGLLPVAQKVRIKPADML